MHITLTTITLFISICILLQGKPLNLENIDYKVNDTIEICSPPNSIVNINTLNYNPETLIRGEPVHLSFEGFLKKEIRSGTLRLDINYGILPLISKTFDLCSFLKIYGSQYSTPQCPINQGKLTYSITTNVPYEIPPGNYRIHAEAWNLEGEPLFCGDAKIEILNKSHFKKEKLNNYVEIKSTKLMLENLFESLLLKFFRKKNNEA